MYLGTVFYREQSRAEQLLCTDDQVMQGIYLPLDVVSICGFSQYLRDSYLIESRRRPRS